MFGRRTALAMLALATVGLLLPMAAAQGTPELVISPRYKEPGGTGSITLPPDLRENIQTETTVYIRTPGAWPCATGARYSITIDVETNWPKWAGASLQPLEDTVIDYQVSGGTTGATARHAEQTFDTATLGLAWGDDAPDNGTHTYTLIVKDVGVHPEGQDCAPSPIQNRDDNFDTLNVTKPYIPPDPEEEEDCLVNPDQAKCITTEATPESPGIGAAGLIVALSALVAILRRRQG